MLTSYLEAPLRKQAADVYLVFESVSPEEGLAALAGEGVEVVPESLVAAHRAQLAALAAPAAVLRVVVVAVLHVDCARVRRHGMRVVCAQLLSLDKERFRDVCHRTDILDFGQFRPESDSRNQDFRISNTFTGGGIWLFTAEQIRMGRSSQVTTHNFVMSPSSSTFYQSNRSLDACELRGSL